MYIYRTGTPDDADNIYDTFNGDRPAQIGSSIMDAYTTLYTAGGVPALVSTAITVIYFAVKFIVYFLNAGTREAEGGKGMLHDSLPRHNQRSMGGTESHSQVYLNIRKYSDKTNDNGRGQWSEATRPVFLHTEQQDLCISPTRDDTRDTAMPPLRANAEGCRGRRRSYSRDNISPGPHGSYPHTTGISLQGRRGEDATNQEPQHYERNGSEGRQCKPDQIRNDGIQESATTPREARYSSPAKQEQEVSTIGIQTESCDTIYVSRVSCIYHSHCTKYSDFTVRSNASCTSNSAKPCVNRNPA